MTTTGMESATLSSFHHLTQHQSMQNHQPLAVAGILGLVGGLVWNYLSPPGGSPKHGDLEDDLPMHEDTELQRPEHISDDDFLQWRSPRRGTAHPERVVSPVWQWQHEHVDEDGARPSAFAVNDLFEGPSSFESGPCWSAERFGQTMTDLPDGRRVWIGGEHEDFYDPDFYIYNDVIVQEVDGTLAFLLYPEDVFPPTDHHSATLHGTEIILVGSLGDSEQRDPATTQVLVLDTKEWKVRRQEVTGDAPPWLSSHQATYDAAEGTITVEGGVLDLGNDGPMLANIDTWQLHLSSWSWERLTKRDWPRVFFERADGEPSDLFMARMDAEIEAMTKLDGFDPEAAAILQEAMAGQEAVPAQKAEVLSLLYTPPLPHTPLESEDDSDSLAVRIEVDGVVVRYDEERGPAMMTIEGHLPDEVVATLIDDFQQKFAAFTGAEITVTRVENP